MQQLTSQDMNEINCFTHSKVHAPRPLDGHWQLPIDTQLAHPESSPVIEAPYLGIVQMLCCTISVYGLVSI